MSNCKKLTRWPCITTVRSLSTELSFSTPFGGLVYFESPGPGTLTVSLSNVVESPLIDLTQPETIQDWPRRRHAPGLWVSNF